MKRNLKMMAAALVMVAFGTNVQAVTLAQNVQVEQDATKQDSEKKDKKSCCKSKAKDKKSCSKSDKKSCSKDEKSKK